jgi:hypothetical protein
MFAVPVQFLTPATRRSEKRAKYYCSPLQLVMTSIELTNIQNLVGVSGALLCFALFDVDNIIFLGTCAALKQARQKK